MGQPAFYAVALAGLFVAYAAVLQLTSEDGLPTNLLAAAINVIPVAVLGLAVRACLRRFVLGLPPLLQAGAHVVMALLFAMAWFWLLMVLRGAASGETVVQFRVTPFPGAAAIWQLYQGLVIYALIAVLIYSEALTASANRQEASAPAGRIFVKQGDDIRPLDVAQVKLIRGADDYSEVVTADAKHLVRVNLSKLGQRLGDRFLRVHRSHLVNIDHIVSAEPAGGGRMLVHMDNGEAVHASRAGARLLRERVV